MGNSYFAISYPYNCNCHPSRWGCVYALAAIAGIQAWEMKWLWQCIGWEVNKTCLWVILIRTITLALYNDQAAFFTIGAGVRVVTQSYTRLIDYFRSSTFSTFPLTMPFPGNTRRWPNIVLLLDQRWRRWANIKPTLGQRLVFPGLVVLNSILCYHHQVSSMVIGPSLCLTLPYIPI